MSCWVWRVVCNLVKAMPCLEWRSPGSWSQYLSHLKSPDGFASASHHPLSWHPSLDGSLPVPVNDLQMLLKNNVQNDTFETFRWVSRLGPMWLPSGHSWPSTLSLDLGHRGTDMEIQHQLQQPVKTYCWDGIGTVLQLHTYISIYIWDDQFTAAARCVQATIKHVPFISWNWESHKKNGSSFQIH